MNNSSDASGGIQKKKWFPQMASLVHLAPLHYSVETPVFGESHKVEEADSASLLNACQPVQKMTENGRQQRGNGTFDWDLIANFWLMRGMRRVPLRKILHLHAFSKSYFFLLCLIFTFSTVNKADQTVRFLPLLWVLGEGLYGVGGKKMRESSNFKRQMRGGIQSLRTSFLPLPLPGVHIS